MAFALIRALPEKDIKISCNYETKIEKRSDKKLKKVSYTLFVTVVD